MIPALWLAALGAAERSSLVSAVQSPSARCTSRFLAVLVVEVGVESRSPGSVVMCSAPGAPAEPPLSVWRIQVHCGPGAPPANSSPTAGRATCSVYVCATPSAAVTAIVAAPGIPVACVTTAVAPDADALTTGGLTAP